MVPKVTSGGRSCKSSLPYYSIKKLCTCWDLNFGQQRNSRSWVLINKPGKYGSDGEMLPLPLTRRNDHVSSLISA